MKAIILNGSPRKNWNTAMMLKEAQKGAGIEISRIGATPRSGTYFSHGLYVEKSTYKTVVFLL